MQQWRRKVFQDGGANKIQVPHNERRPPQKKNGGRSRATSRLRLWSTVETYTRQLTYELTAPFKSAAAPLTVQQGRPCQVTSKNATLLSNPSCLFQNARRPSSEFWGATAPLPPPPLPPPLPCNLQSIRWTHQISHVLVIIEGKAKVMYLTSDLPPGFKGNI